MPKAHNPHRGSMQFWPRKRSRHNFVRVRSWATAKDAKPLGFVAYKAGMTHVMAVDNRSKSQTKGEKIAIPVTIMECPSMYAVAVVTYSRHSRGLKKEATVVASDLPKDLKKSLSRRVSVAKKSSNSLESLSAEGLADVRVLVASVPGKTSVGRKASELIELGLGGSVEEQLAAAKELLGSEIPLESVFAAGDVVDVRAVTKGKGFQGVVKRYGVAMVSHKSEKGQRKIANMGAWTPKRVDYRVAQPGKMGYHQRTEYNKQIIQIGSDAALVNSKGGLNHYGLVKNNYVLIKGSVPGPIKSSVLLTASLRGGSRTKFAGAPEVTYISR